MTINLRSGPIWAVLIHSLLRLPLKVGLIQTITSLCSLRPDFGRNADWLLEQCHKIWLAVGNAGSWKRLFLAWLFSWMIRRLWREGSILLSFIVLWSYGRKICLNMCHGNSENSCGCSYLLRICFNYGKWVYRGVESLCKLLTANRVHFDLPTSGCKSKYCPS